MLWEDNPVITRKTGYGIFRDTFFRGFGYEQDRFLAAAQKEAKGDIAATPVEFAASTKHAKMNKGPSPGKFLARNNVERMMIRFDIPTIKFGRSVATTAAEAEPEDSFSDDTKPEVLSLRKTFPPQQKWLRLL